MRQNTNNVVPLRPSWQAKELLAQLLRAEGAAVRINYVTSQIAAQLGQEIGWVQGVLDALIEDGKIIRVSPGERGLISLPAADLIREGLVTRAPNAIVHACR